MVQVQSLMVTAIEGRRNFSYGQELREVWYRREDGIEGSLQYSGDFGVRAGNKLASQHGIPGSSAKCLWQAVACIASGCGVGCRATDRQAATQGGLSRRR